jgi:hypothetical protein
MASLSLFVLHTAVAVAASDPDTLGLDGSWSFALDEGNVGLAHGWRSAPAFADTIAVPGISVGAAGFGSPTDQKRREYNAGVLSQGCHREAAWPPWPPWPRGCIGYIPTHLLLNLHMGSILEARTY